MRDRGVERGPEQGAAQAAGQWYAVHTKPRQEELALEQLRRQGYEGYLPRLRERRRIRRRWQEVVAPLFPRYLFVRLREGVDDFGPIRSTIGVSDLVRFGGRPRPVPEGLVEELRAREDPAAGMHVLERRWRPGERLRVVEGPLAGLEAVFQAETAEERVIVLLRLLGRDTRVAVPRDALEPL